MHGTGLARQKLEIQANLVGGRNEAGCPWITVSVEGMHDEAGQHSTHQDDQQTQEVKVESSEKSEWMQKFTCCLSPLRRTENRAESIAMPMLCCFRAEYETFVGRRWT